NVVDSNFLYYMNRSLNSGFRVAQGFREAKNPADNWISGSYAIFYLFQNVFFNHTRRKMRLSASINGTGFMIKKELIDEVGFDTKTLTEDVEFSGLCALRNEKIDFVEDAITYDENPVDFKSSWKQRKRWTAGNLSCMKLYSAKLFGHFIKTRNLSALDLSLRYSAPVVQVVGFANFLLLSFFKVIGIELSDIFSRFFALGFLCMVISYFIGLIMEIILLKYKGKSVKPMVSGLLMFAFFVLTWVSINFVCLIKKQTSWEEIKHNRNISIAEIVKNYR
ncbi:glycosyltransferase, partial [bacterium]|nr:glycosyltransferase [bacterium]